ncbi:MAG: hypothetical protein WC455_17795 [Dehalococcoidia bacterium]|jgi:hypothetical protein
MKPINFREANVVFAKDQPEYIPLPAHRTSDGTVTTCWRASLCERLRFLMQGRMFLQVMTFNAPIQPLFMTTENFLRHASKEQPK